MTAARKIQIVALAVLVLGVGGLAWGKAEVETTHEVVQVDLVAYNECSGEDVAISGEIRVRTHYVVRASSGAALQVHIRTEGEGVGLDSGAEYHIRGGTNQVVTGDGEQLRSHTIVEREILIGKGSTPNRVYEYRLNFKRNANGEVTVNLLDLSIECR